MPAKTVIKLGASRERVRVYLEGDLVRVRYRDLGKRKTKSWPKTKENIAAAKVFAQGIIDGRAVQTRLEPLTLRQIWERFAEAEFHALRPKTRKLYREYWGRWETMWGRNFVTNLTTLDMANQFRSALTKQKKAISTIRHSLETVKMVYRWADKHELLERNRLALYEFRVGKDQRKAPPPEYTAEEADKILAQLDPNKATEWRAWVALTICRHQGVRQNSVLHLQWGDVNTTAITWRAPWDKNGKEWAQPLRDGTRKAIAIAARWSPTWYNFLSHGCPWVIPSGSSKNEGKCYTIGALYLALRKAEKRAGVKHLPNRGGHGLRRLLAGDVNAATGDSALAMLAIGDDVRQAHRYIQKRDTRLEEAFRTLDNPEQKTKVGVE